MHADTRPGAFGLAYAGAATDTRSELGSRFDKEYVVSRNAVLMLRARTAWARHRLKACRMTGARIELDQSCAIRLMMVIKAGFVQGSDRPLPDMELEFERGQPRLLLVIRRPSKHGPVFGRTCRPEGWTTCGWATDPPLGYSANDLRTFSADQLLPRR